MRTRDSKNLPSVFMPAVLSVLLIVGCAHQPIGPKLESSAVAQGIGFAACKVSVPLDRDEVLDFADKLGNPNLGTSSEWAKAISLMQPGDQLRHVYCRKSGNNFFGVFRGNIVLFRFGSMLYN